MPRYAPGNKVTLTTSGRVDIEEQHDDRLDPTDSRRSKNTSYER
jgi:hypothetical protein